MKKYRSRLSKIFFVGIGGSGMSGIAEVLINLNYEVSGSDISDSEIIDRLRSMGAEIHIGHAASNIDTADMIVISSAIDHGNPELIAAKLKGIPVLARAEMLSSLMNMKRGIAIAGTHGKTTTTSLVASIFTEASLDPTFINGGIINSFASNAKLGKGDYLVAEADESDQSFLMLQPSVSIITNIEEDHLINYGNDFENLRQAFLSFIKKLPFDGLLIACGDDPEVKKLLPQCSRPIVTYGFDEINDYVISNYEPIEFRSQFLLTYASQSIHIDLNMLGRHNALNASAACVLAIEEGIDTSIIQVALKNFMGISRRMQVVGNMNIKNSNLILIDDYGHHPSEIKNTIESIRESHPKKKLTMVFQPHRYSRTKDLFEEFIEVLQLVDQLILLDVYPAGEDSIKNYESKDLLKKLKDTTLNVCLSEESKVNIAIEESLENHEGIILMQGAGNISKISESLMKAYGN
ncbi:UDP-N-acetylmuramate--L-alanine ligase [Gammaproteobacteria bacterium]|nr:UDP-N-acetylmuramate--L-alanine ligase [Gammaproteobacteria bacterium]